MRPVADSCAIYNALYNVLIKLELEFDKCRTFLPLLLQKSLSLLSFEKIRRNGTGRAVSKKRAMDSDSDFDREAKGWSG